MRLLAIFLITLMLASCQASGTATSRGTSANFFTNIFTLEF